MGVRIGENKLKMETEPKTIYFDLPKNIGNNSKHEIDFMIKHNEFLSEHTIQNEISRALFKYKHGNDIHEHGKQ